MVTKIIKELAYSYIMPTTSLHPYQKQKKQADSHKQNKLMFFHFLNCQLYEIIFNGKHIILSALPFHNQTKKTFVL